MGTWTKVRGQIVVGDWQAEKLEAALGKVVNIYASDVEWDTAHRLSEAHKSAMPMGSEGSLQWDAYHNKAEQRIVVDIHGNLRDFVDIDHIKQWFWAACAKLNVMSAFLEINDIANMSIFIDESKELFRMEKDF